MCDQQSLRSACAYAQSDQSLCKSLGYSITVKLLTEHHLEYLSLKGDSTDSSESALVKMPRYGNHMSRLICYRIFSRTSYGIYGMFLLLSSYAPVILVEMYGFLLNLDRYVHLIGTTFSILPI